MTQSTLGESRPAHLVSSPSHASGRPQTRSSTQPRLVSAPSESRLTLVPQPRQAATPEPRSAPIAAQLPVSRLTPPSRSSPAAPTQSHSAAGSPSDLPAVESLFDLPAADSCLRSLLQLQHLRPPARPNTDIKVPIFSASKQPARQGSLQTRLTAWRALLAHYPCQSTIAQILGAIQHGVHIGYDGPLRGVSRAAPNLPMDAAGLAHVRRETEQRLLEGRLTIVTDLSGLVCSPIGTVPKPHSAKLRTIHHLSHPRVASAGHLPSVNQGILPEFVTLEYENLHPLLDFVRENPNCLLWKDDLRDAFRHIVTCVSDAALLGFTLDGVAYRENALTFGGRSSPWLFNLFAEMLHWIVSSCTRMPVHHYLDDFFGATPSHSLEEPVRILALACQALGFTLAEDKTFHAQTCLEILGIEIDSARQSVGITDKRRSRILAVCSGLLAQPRASLLQLQQVAGLLQFVSQVAPLGRAYLGRLYAALRRAHRSPASRLRLSRPAQAELRWWRDLLSSWCGSSILSSSPLVAIHMWTDASLRALGGHLGLASSPTASFFRDVPRRHRRKNIRFLEALAVLDSLRVFLPHVLASGASHLVVHVDNENVEFGLRSGRSRDPLTQTLLREIFGLCFHNRLTLVPVCVSSAENVLADLLSRRKFSQIRTQFPVSHRHIFSQGKLPKTSAKSPRSSPSNLADPTTPLHCSGTVSPPNLAASTTQSARRTRLSACARSAPLSAASPRQTAPSWNGSPISAETARRITQSRTVSLPCAPGTSIWASTPLPSATIVCAARSEVSNACTASPPEARSCPSPSQCSTASSTPSVPSHCSPRATKPRSTALSPSPTPASCAVQSSPGPPSTPPPPCASGTCAGPQISPRSACLAPKPTPLDRVSTWLSLAPGALSARTPHSKPSATAAQLRLPFSPLGTAPPLSRDLDSSLSFASSFSASAFPPTSTPDIPSGAAPLPGPPLWELPTPLSRPSDAGPRIASNATLTSPRPRKAVSRRFSCSALSPRAART